MVVAPRLAQPADHFASHLRRLSTLKTADQVVFMEDGVVAEQGTYDELAQEGTRFNLLVRSQLLGGPPITTAASKDV